MIWSVRGEQESILLDSVQIEAIRIITGLHSTTSLRFMMNLFSGNSVIDQEA